MAFALMDDQIHGHPKFARAGLEAIGLWALCLSYCSAYLTDGYVSREVAERFAGGKLDRLADRLITCGGPGKPGLWDLANGGWMMHDYLDWNPSRAEVLEKRQAERDRKAKGRNTQGRDAGGRITSERIPIGHLPESAAGHTGSHAHAHTQDKESEQRASARVDGLRKLLAKNWGTWGTNVLAPDGLGIEAVARLLVVYADASGEPDAALAERAVCAFLKLLRSWSFTGYATPHLFVKKWDEVQAVLGGAEPGRKQARAVGARKHNDGIGAQPVTKEEDY